MQKAIDSGILNRFWKKEKKKGREERRKEEKEGGQKEGQRQEREEGWKEFKHFGYIQMVNTCI